MNFFLLVLAILPQIIFARIDEPNVPKNNTHILTLRIQQPSEYPVCQIVASDVALPNYMPYDSLDVAFSPDKKHFFQVNRGGNVLYWKNVNGTWIFAKTFTRDQTKGQVYQRITFSDQSNFAVLDSSCATDTNQITVVNLADLTSQDLLTWKVDAPYDGWFSVFAFSSSENRLAYVAQNGHMIRIFDLATSKIVDYVLMLKPANPISSISFNPINPNIIAAKTFNDGYVTLINLTTRHFIGTLRAKSDYSADGDWTKWPSIIWNSDATILSNHSSLIMATDIWDWATQNEQTNIRWNPFSPLVSLPGQPLFFVGQPDRIVLYNTTSQQSRTIFPTQNYTRAISFSPNAEMFAVASFTQFTLVSARDFSNVCEKTVEKSLSNLMFVDENNLYVVHNDFSLSQWRVNF